MRNYCTICKWSASLTERRDLNRAAITHYLATGHRIESERQEQVEDEEQHSCGEDYRIDEILK